MDTIKFVLKLVVAGVLVLTILEVAHRWDESDSQQLRMSMLART